jgi:hypothetical protein
VFSFQSFRFPFPIFTLYKYSRNGNGKRQTHSLRPLPSQPKLLLGRALLYLLLHCTLPRPCYPTAGLRLGCCLKQNALDDTGGQGYSFRQVGGFPPPLNQEAPASGVAPRIRCHYPSKKPIVPKGLDRPSLLAEDGDDLEVHYRHILEELGRKPGCWPRKSSATPKPSWSSSKPP